MPRLSKYQEMEDALVVGLARGGVVTAYEVAAGLNLPLAAFVVRKIGAPGNEEFAIGAISETGDAIFNQAINASLGVTQAYIKKTVEKERKVAQERSAHYRGKKSLATAFKGKTVILVDDGIATGASVEVAIQSLKKAGAKKIILAVPVSAPDSFHRLESEVDEIISLSTPANFYAVGSHYELFDQTSDEEIIHLLAKAA